MLIITDLTSDVVKTARIQHYVCLPFYFILICNKSMAFKNFKSTLAMRLSCISVLLHIQLDFMPLFVPTEANLGRIYTEVL